MMPWQEEGWIAANVASAEALMWRAVEAQHVVATMGLVDGLDEQYLLEQMLDASKPAPPEQARHTDFLLYTPFRYVSPHASRFRRAGEPGVWYGARDRETACAEVGYWRWRFLMDSTGLAGDEVVTLHTLFQARVSGPRLDLCEPPWPRLDAWWRHPGDWSACHQLAAAARELGVQWLRYASARHPQGICAAAFSPTALTLPRPTRQETWLCAVRADQVIFRHDGEGFAFNPQTGAGPD